MSKLTRYEQETIINFNAEDKMATVYTRDPVVIRKVDALVIEYPDTFRCVAETDIDKTYEMPKKNGSIIFFVGLPPRNVLICYATLDRMEKQCCSFITDGEELKNNLLFLRQAT